jgi:hypothetical protein
LRPSALRGDRAGVTDIPFKLLLSVVLMTMAVAVLMPALSAYQQSEVEHRIQLAVAEIDAAARAAYHHPGSSRTVLVDVPSSGSYRLVGLTVGGDLCNDGHVAAIISWRHSGGVEGHHVVATRGGPVYLAGSDGGPLDLEGDRFLLVLEARAAPPGCQTPTFVEVRTI